MSAELPISRRDGACAALSAAEGEPLAGTAGSTVAWLLVEHPGPWPSVPLEPALGTDLLTELRRRAPDVRVVLIRRDGRRAVSKPRCVLAWTGGATRTPPVQRELVLDSYGELRDLDLESLARGVPSDGVERHGPMFLVCTHGKRDACCAEFGRPALRAVAGAHSEVWECTHVGGDRFAATMVCFPHGLYYGRLTPASALAVANDYSAGRLQLRNLRGRSGLPSAAQAAEYFVRRHEGPATVDGVTTGVPSDDHEVTVRVTSRAAADGAGERRYGVRLRRVPVAAPLPGGCDEAEPSRRYAWALADVIRALPSEA